MVIARDVQRFHRAFELSLLSPVIWTLHVDPIDVGRHGMLGDSVTRHAAKPKPTGPFVPFALPHSHSPLTLEESD